MFLSTIVFISNVLLVTIYEIILKLPIELVNVKIDLTRFIETNIIINRKFYRNVFTDKRFALSTKKCLMHFCH